MNITDSLTHTIDTLSGVVSNSATPTNISTESSYQWAYWVGAALALGAISLQIIKRKNYKRNSLKKKMMEGDVNFENVIGSAFHSQEIYDLLKKRCHPDRFAGNKDLESKATELFALITKNRYNQEVLKELKERAEKELFIKF